MKNFFPILLLVTAALTLQACSKDQDLDDYKKTRLQKNLAEIQTANGKYSGYLLSKQSGANLGALQLTLTATTQVQPSTDESKSSAQPVLLVSVTFQGVSRMTTSAEDTYFDPDTGAFQADVPIVQQAANGQSQTIKISLTGILSNGVLKGTMEAKDYPDYGGTFSLSNKGASLDSLVQASKPTGAAFSQGTYAGTTTFGKVSKNVSMIILKPVTTSDQDFVSLFFPKIPVKVTLNYGDGALVNFDDSTLDQTNSTVQGNGTITKNNQTETLSLTCNGQNTDQHFECSVKTSSAVGEVAHLSLQASTDDANKGPADSDTSSYENHSYDGTVTLRGGVSKPAELTVSYAARNRQDEINDLYFPQAETLLNVNYTLDNGAFGVTFTDVKWDSAKGTLDVTQQGTSDGLSATFSLNCRGFTFGPKPYSFTCDFHSSLGNTYEQIVFKSNP